MLGQAVVVAGAGDAAIVGIGAGAAIIAPWSGAVEASGGAEIVSSIAQNPGTHTVYQEVVGGTVRYVGQTAVSRLLAFLAAEKGREVAQPIEQWRDPHQFVIIAGKTRLGARPFPIVHPDRFGAT